MDENKEQPKFAQVEVAFLQALLEYLQTKPYQEVFRFVDVLTGRSLPPQQGQPSVTSVEPAGQPEGFEPQQSNVVEG